MSVHAPGRFGFEPTIGRKAVAHARGGRPLRASLAMGGFVDVLVVSLTYLLLAFSATGECGCREPIRLPTGAENTLEMIDAPIVTVAERSILVDGNPAGDAVDVPPGQVHRIDALFDVLRAKRDVWRQLHPGKEPPGVVVLAIDRDVPAYVVKSVVHTAATSGYPELSFLVEYGAATSRIAL